MDLYLNEILFHSIEKRINQATDKCIVLFLSGLNWKKALILILTSCVFWFFSPSTLARLCFRWFLLVLYAIRCKRVDRMHVSHRTGLCSKSGCKIEHQSIFYKKYLCIFQKAIIYKLRIIYYILVTWYLGTRRKIIRHHVLSSDETYDMATWQYLATRGNI